MAENLVVATAFGGKYQWYAPFFIYAWMKAYPDVDVLVFSDNPDKRLIELLGEMKSLHMCRNDWLINSVDTQPLNKEKYCGAAQRFLLDKQHIGHAKYTLFSDVDIIALPHKTAHFHYYRKVMKKTGLPYAGIRGAIRRPYCPHVAPEGWRKEFARICGGMFAVETSPWLEKTERARKYYVATLASNKHDKFDKHAPASYREYDEVMLARILTMSGIKAPVTKNCFVNGEPYNFLYRDVHAGDFKFKDRYKDQKKMRRILSIQNAIKYKRLFRETEWKYLFKNCRSETVKQELDRAYDFCEKL